ncbi:MAG TPA: AMP-binding protein [Arenimonas sp.]|uniref:AMP-binding protein n=1 Tax=Arenimonas sp. TaxID=1872635 RepID=UPI002BDAACD3|nr:AMP-binding protein [Arenimonas sp.]HMB56978.1 AMP-binding protein [Arenimonas sp.]
MAEWLPLSRLLSPPGDVATRIVAIGDAGHCDFAAFRQQVSRWQAMFSSRPGRRIALHCEHSLPFAAALFGAWHAGKIVYLPGDTLPATLERMLPMVDYLVGDLPGALGSDDLPEVAPTTTFSALDPEATRLVIHTSGSSGEPVAIEKKLRQLDAELLALEQRFGTIAGDAHIHGTVSHQHIYGLLFRVLWPLAAGRAFHSRRLAYPEQIAATITSAPAMLVASPAQLKRLPESIDWRATRSALRAVFSSGGPLPADAGEAVEKLWQQCPIEVFGSSETGGIASRQGAAQAWSPLPGVEWRVHEQALEIRSPHLPDQDWYRTADRAVAVEDGFNLLGRADRIVKLEERRISLSAIEQRLLASPFLQEVRLLVLAGERALVAAVAVPTREGHDLLACEGRLAFSKQLREWLAGHVDAIALPRRWRFVDALPADAQGKSSEARLALLFKPMLPTPEWLDRSSKTAALELDVNADLAGFDGHFPAMPVLPGVVLLDWAIKFGREAFAIDGAFARMDVLKFQLLVRPGTRLHLQIDWQTSVNTLGFRYTSRHGTHASGRVLFQNAEAAVTE